MKVVGSRLGCEGGHRVSCYVAHWIGYISCFGAFAIQSEVNMYLAIRLLVRDCTVPVNFLLKLFNLQEHLPLRPPIG